MADKNYLPQTQADQSATEAAEHTDIFSITLAANALSSWYFPGNARHIYWIGQQANCYAVIRGQGGDGAAANVYSTYKSGAPTPYSTAYSSADTPQTPGQLGMISSDHIPYEFALVNSNASESKVTLYICY